MVDGLIDVVEKILIALSSGPSTHTRKEGEPGIQYHVTYISTYTKVGRVAGSKLVFKHSVLTHVTSVVQSFKASLSVV